jgi:hypothetical protein
MEYCPECGAVVGSQPPPELRPLRGLGNVLIVLLAVVIATIAARLGIRLLGLPSAGWRGGYAVRQLDKAADITIFATGIVFVVWFRGARINAEHRGWRQRRARGWTFWGWIVPVVSLWFPFQLMGDIWRAGLPDWRRGKTAWLPALWWTCWLLSGVGPAQSTAGYKPWPQLTADALTTSLCFLAVSGVTLIAIIHAVSYGPLGSPHPSPQAEWPAALPA